MSYVVYSDHLAMAHEPVVFERKDSSLGVWDWMADAIALKAAERATCKALTESNDHQLLDIGVQRSEIRVLARNVAADPGIEHRSLR